MTAAKDTVAAAAPSRGGCRVGAGSGWWMAMIKAFFFWNGGSWVPGWDGGRELGAQLRGFLLRIEEKDPLPPLPAPVLFLARPRGRWIGAGPSFLRRKERSERQMGCERCPWIDRDRRGRELRRIMAGKKKRSGVSRSRRSGLGEQTGARVWAENGIRLLATKLP